MARIERVAVKIIEDCSSNISYSKLQKLIYICQCVYYAIYGESLSSEVIWYWSNGCEFEEIYDLFKKFNIKTGNFVDIDVVNKIKLDDFKDEDLYLSKDEEVIIDFVLFKYGNKKTEELLKLTTKELLLKKYEICDQVCLDDLDDLFITEEEKDYLKNLNIDNAKQGCKKRILKNKLY